jgi:hypothetical protein
MVRVLVPLSILLVNLAACSKKAEPPPNPPAGSGGSAAAGSAATGSASGATAGSAATGAGSGSASGATGSGAGGSAAGGSAAGGSAAGGSAAGGSAVAPPDRKVEDPRESELCSKVLKKIVECQKDKEFLSALNEGVDATQKKLNVRLLKEVARWKPAETECANLPAGLEYGGFLDHWDRIAAVPDLIESCGKLGTMINTAGGLFGGDRAY